MNPAESKSLGHVPEIVLVNGNNFDNNFTGEYSQQINDDQKNAIDISEVRQNL